MPHAYRLLLEQELRRKGWNNQQLADASGVSKQRVSQILKDSRDVLKQRPEPVTVESLASALDIPPERIWNAVARAMGIPVSDPGPLVRKVEEASNEDLLAELSRRLDARVVRGRFGSKDSSDAAPTVGGAIAALDDGSIAGEQESTNEP